MKSGSHPNSQFDLNMVEYRIFFLVFTLMFYGVLLAIPYLAPLFGVGLIMALMPGWHFGIVIPTGYLHAALGVYVAFAIFTPIMYYTYFYLVRAHGMSLSTFVQKCGWGDAVSHVCAGIFWPYTCAAFSSAYRRIWGHTWPQATMSVIIYWAYGRWSGWSSEKILAQTDHPSGDTSADDLIPEHPKERITLRGDTQGNSDKYNK